MSSSSSTRTFHQKRRAYQVGKGLIFLVFVGSGIYQSILRYNLEAGRFWDSWWFFALLSLGFLYLAVETFYRVFFARLVFTPQEIILYDFPKAIHIPWSDIQRVGGITHTDKKNDFGLVLKDAIVEKEAGWPLPVISLVPYFNDWNECPIRLWLKENKPHLLKETPHGK